MFKHRLLDYHYSLMMRCKSRNPSLDYQSRNHGEAHPMSCCSLSSSEDQWCCFSKTNWTSGGWSNISARILDEYHTSMNRRGSSSAHLLLLHIALQPMQWNWYVDPTGDGYPARGHGQCLDVCISSIIKHGSKVFYLQLGFWKQINVLMNSLCRPFVKRILWFMFDNTC